MTFRPSLAHAIWLKPHPAAFLYLPKVACTSWKLYLWQALGNRLDDDFNYRQVHNRDTLPLPYVDGMPAAMQAAFMAGIGDGSIATYAVLREPRGRILSAYLDKIRFHANPGSFFSRCVIPEIQAFAGLDPEQRPSFADFLGWIAAQSDRDALNDHWRPMVSLLGTADPGACTRLWTMEHMDRAVAVLADLLDCRLPFPTREALGSRRTYDSERQVGDYYGAAEQALFARIYAEDEALYRAVAAG